MDNRYSSPQDRQWGEGPSGDDDVVAYINNTPLLMSLLYDIDLLPEQHWEKPRDGKEWCDIFTITNHWRERELSLRSEIAQTTGGRGQDMDVLRDANSSQEMPSSRPENEAAALATTSPSHSHDDKSGTPRTVAQLRKTGGCDWVPANFARRLERELRIKSDFLSSRQCPDHNGKWERGGCLQCELEKLTNELNAARSATEATKETHCWKCGRLFVVGTFTCTQAPCGAIVDKDGKLTAKIMLSSSDSGSDSE